MNKSEIIDSIKATTGLTKRTIDDALSAFVDLIQSQERIVYPGLGVFRHKVKPERKARNPKTGETVIVPEHTALVFKASKSGKE